MGDLNAMIASLLKHGPDLRKAGYQSVTIGEVSFTLHPPEPDYPAQATTTTSSPTNPLNDPSTYGLSEGDKPPGFTDPRKKQS